MYFYGKSLEKKKSGEYGKHRKQSGMTEELGIITLRATACKTPAVAYNVPGLKNSVKHIETGLLVELRNIQELARAITYLLTDNNL